MANLPNADQAIVETRKVTDYLLSETHPQGAAKARFFRAFGFTPERPEAFISCIREHAERYEVTAVEHTRYGSKYTVEGPLDSPDGRRPNVRCVWFIEGDEASPRLVTVVPMRSEPE